MYRRTIILEAGTVLRRALWRMANQILVTRENRIAQQLNEVILPQSESNLPFGNLSIARASRPVVEARQFSNLVACSPVPVPAHELETLCGPLLRT